MEEINKIYKGNKQQDAHELLLHTVEELHSKSNPDEKSHLKNTFEGNQQTMIKCKKCKSREFVTDPFKCLPVIIPEKGKSDIHSCLRTITQEEEVTDRWCTTCQENGEATKSTSISKMPQILTIQLKRFNMVEKWQNKIYTNITFPTRNLDLKEYTEISEHQHKYDLVGVANHEGKCTGGHYTATCKDPVIGSWFTFNDAIVTSIEENEVPTKDAYLLFYQKQEKSENPSKETEEKHTTKNVEQKTPTKDKASDKITDKKIHVSGVRRTSRKTTSHYKDQESESIEKENENKNNKENKKATKKNKKNDQQKQPKSNEKKEGKKNVKNQNENNIEEEVYTCKAKPCNCQNEEKEKEDYWIICDYCNNTLHGNACANIPEESIDSIVKYQCPECCRTRRGDKEEDEIERLQKEISKKDRSLEDKEETIQWNLDQIERQKNSTKTAKLQWENEEKTLRKLIDETRKEIRELQKETKTKSNKITELEKKIKKDNKEEEKESRLQASKDSKEIKKLEAKIKETENEISQLRNNSDTQAKELAEEKNRCKKVVKESEKQQQSITEKEEKIGRLQQEIEALKIIEQNIRAIETGTDTTNNKAENIQAVLSLCEVKQKEITEKEATIKKISEENEKAKKNDKENKDSIKKQNTRLQQFGTDNEQLIKEKCSLVKHNLFIEANNRTLRAVIKYMELEEDFIQEKKNNTNKKTDKEQKRDANTSKKQNQTGKNREKNIPCKFFKAGRCTFGDRCWNVHQKNPKQTYHDRQESTYHQKNKRIDDLNKEKEKKQEKNKHYKTYCWYHENASCNFGERCNKKHWNSIGEEHNDETEHNSENKLENQYDIDQEETSEDSEDGNITVIEVKTSEEKAKEINRNKETEKKNVEEEKVGEEIEEADRNKETEKKNIEEEEIVDEEIEEAEPVDKMEAKQHSGEVEPPQITEEARETENPEKVKEMREMREKEQDGMQEINEQMKHNNNNNEDNDNSDNNNNNNDNNNTNNKETPAGFPLGGVRIINNNSSESNNNNENTKNTSQHEKKQ